MLNLNLRVQKRIAKKNTKERGQLYLALK